MLEEILYDKLEELSKQNLELNRLLDQKRSDEQLHVLTCGYKQELRMLRREVKQLRREKKVDQENISLMKQQLEDAESIRSKVEEEFWKQMYELMKQMKAEENRYQAQISAIEAQLNDTKSYLLQVQAELQEQKKICEDVYMTDIEELRTELASFRSNAVKTELGLVSEICQLEGQRNVNEYVSNTQFYMLKQSNEDAESIRSKVEEDFWKPMYELMKQQKKICEDMYMTDIEALKTELADVKSNAIQTEVGLVSEIRQLERQRTVNEYLSDTHFYTMKSTMRRESAANELSAKKLTEEMEHVKSELSKKDHENNLLAEEIDELKEELERLNEREKHFNIPIMCKEGSRFNFCSGNANKCKLCKALIDTSSTECTPKKLVTTEETGEKFEFDHWVKIKRYRQRKLWGSNCLKKCCNLETSAVRKVLGK